MGNLFNIENGLFTTIGKIVDIIFISVIWFICCIPIFTIGPANTALYYTVVKVIRRDRGYLTKEFFKCYRLNFKKGMLIGLLFTVMFVIIIVDIIWSNATSKGGTAMESAMVGVFIAIGIIIFSMSVYIFPLLSRFDMTIKQLFKASLFMAIKHLPSTFTMVVLIAGSILAVYLIQPLFIFILPGLSVLISSFVMERVIKKYMPEKEEVEEDTSKDAWYLE